MTERWLPCPYTADYPFDAARVRAQWQQLHAVDAEPEPTQDTLLEAWAHFHSGRFAQAVETGLAAGVDGWSVVNRATAAYAALLEPSETRRLELYRAVHLQAVTHAAQRPLLPNAWYWQGYALAHYAQGIHVARALAQGLGPQVRAALQASLALDPLHAYARVALGAFEAAVIDKVGPLLGALTYGATAASALKHLRRALELAPDSPAVLMECGNALQVLEAPTHLAEATALHEKVTRLQARDAVERLWIELARASLEL